MMIIQDGQLEYNGGAGWFSPYYNDKLGCFVKSDKNPSPQHVLNDNGTWIRLEPNLIVQVSDHEQGIFV